MEFSVAIDSAFLELWAKSKLHPVENKRLLSLLNDFEDGVWRLEKFKNFVWNNIADTALSRREREALKDQPSTLLTEAAKRLRLTDSEKDVGKGSELAEVVLYGIMKHVYNALPVVPKIFYKQNVQDNAKGADSVHIVLESGDDFSLWFGEAKFYNGIEDTRLTEILKTVGNSLATDKLKKENSIVTSLTDLDDLAIDETLKKKIRGALSHEASIDALKSRIHVPILLLHECQLTAAAVEATPEYLDAVKKHHTERALSYFTKQIDQLGSIYMYASIHFHLILFPVPNKKIVVDSFVKKAKSFRE
jgi:hypothetical protein